MKDSNTNKLEVPDFVVRMIKEYKELNERIVNGHKFFTIENIITQSTWTLGEQLDHMKKYRDALSERIQSALWSLVRKEFPKSFDWKDQKLNDTIMEAIREYL